MALLFIRFQESMRPAGGRWVSVGLQSHTDAGVLEAHREDALVDSVKLYQLQEIDEQGHAVVYGEVLPASFLTRDHQVMFGPQLVAQRQDEALFMLLAVTDQEHPVNQPLLLYQPLRFFSRHATMKPRLRLVDGGRFGSRA